MRRLALLLASCLLALAACGSETAPGVAGGAGAATGDAANLDFTGTTLDGEAFDGASLAGKPAVLWFWAPWCPTCRAQIGTVSALAEQYDGQVAVIGVGSLDSPDSIAELAAQIPHVTHLVDADGAVWRHFGVTAQSTYEVISADGDLVSEGYLDDDQLISLVAQLAG